MPEIVFKGKEYVYNHHLSVPYRPLVADAAKGVGPADLNGNLVVHGDNLHALKSLLPRYAGSVDLIFIDPPYNTGNEGWCYSDGVNSPIMKEWLNTNPVDGEDMLRHDKWLCMMWPRLVLLRELLSERGSIWITLDDNEVHRARMVLDEIFGEDAFIANVIWQKNYSPKSTAQFFSEDHDHLLVIAKDRALWRPRLLERTAEMDARYENQGNDKRGPWKASDLSARNFYSEGTYPITCPSGRIIEGPPPGSYWRVKESKFKEMDAEGRIWWGEDGNNIPAIKRYLSEVKQGRVPQTLWFYDEVGHTQDAKKTLLEMGVLKNQESTITPKPVALIERVLEIGADENALILDSFAGSGTTAHAVLKANAKDGGQRKFILVEGEAYADTLTAERVRRAIKGYAWSGTQRETLLEEKITLTQFKKAEQWLAKIDALKREHGLADEGAAGGDLVEQAQSASAAVATAQGKSHRPRFDKIEAKIDDGVLRVEGVRRISEMAPGLGGSFTYCTLGEAVELEKLLSGERLPAFEALGAWLFYTATGGTLQPLPKGAPTHYLGEALDKHVWLIYQPDVNYLKSPEAALVLSRAQAMQAWGLAHDKALGRVPKGHLVFAPAKYLSNKQLKACGVDYAPLPFALYREA
ncbi:adenine-specific DNA-methyltransferase [Aquabacterium commune]|uniref:site-specific DNA-methyltransferase (adenine-specific) n=1 Tax=Aquabacterium commune TaxID=70586 RepID=A0A4R6RB58_9BURK|nr:site-specific DNA-methyltransferase [Aquabacterium commune]TDP82877.1 adenine-specific DNA-methyltransferase [Aquabacterium commune]